jgi:uncharacterized protein YbgA (DUF1722 family)
LITGDVRPRVAVPSCLLGEPVRFNGGHSRDRFLSGALSEHVEWVPICPEMEIGLGTPRETLRLERSARGPRLVGVHPLLAVEDEGRLHDAVLREAFVERIFAVARLRELLDGDWRARDLVAFHAAHKMQLLAHAPGSTASSAGSLVAEAGSRPRDALAAEYGHAFRTAFAARASLGRNANVLEHCLGMVGDHLGRIRRADVLDVIGSYRARRVALSAPVTLLRHHARGEGVTYVSDQTYFRPYPDDLGLRNHIAA